MSAPDLIFALMINPDAYPSPLVPLDILGPEGSSMCHEGVLIPEQELFRAREIFAEAGYAIPAARSHAEPLTIVDIGANIGLFSLYMKFVDDMARIHCYEPVPSTVELLRRNVNRVSGIDVHPYALGHGGRKAQIHLSAHNTGANSIEHRVGRTETVSIDVRDAGAEIDALDVERIDVLKIDTEGCEVEILESLGGRVDRADYVLVEYHSDADRRAIDALLAGFRLFACKADMIDCGVVKYAHPRLSL